MKLEKEHSNTLKLGGKQSRYTDIIIRPFESCDADVVRNIFAESMGEMRSPLVRDVMYQAIVYGLYLSLPAAVLSVVWFSWFLALYFIIFIFILIVLFAVLHIGFSRYIQRCLDTDLGDIENTYFQQKMSHLWVAECNQIVIGMVALVPDTDHEGCFGKSGEVVGRLRRMAVLPEFRRLGVAKQLLDTLLSYAKQVGYKQIVLLTTSAQEAAIKFYTKHDFQLVSKRLANRAMRGFYHFDYSYDLERRK